MRRQQLVHLCVCVYVVCEAIRASMMCMCHATTSTFFDNSGVACIEAQYYGGTEQILQLDGASQGPREEIVCVRSIHTNCIDSLY